MSSGLITVLNAYVNMVSAPQIMWDKFENSLRVGISTYMLIPVPQITDWPTPEGARQVMKGK